MRSGRSASVGIIAKLMDVPASFGVGIVAADMISDLRGSRLGDLFEGNGSGDLGVPAKDRNWCSNAGVSWLSGLPSISLPASNLPALAMSRKSSL